MSPRKPLLTAAAILSLLAGCTTMNSTPAALPPHTVTNIVLVHGAWADGSSWSKLIPLLQRKGYHVTAVQNPLTTLADDVAATKRAIALQDGPVLLVGHSYGGSIITEAGNDPKVVGLVYVAAFAPDAGQSAFEQGAPYPTPAASEFRPDAAGFLLLTPKGIAEDFAPDLSSTERNIMTATQGPTAVAALTGKISRPAWKDKPTWYIVASNDRMIAPALERENAAKMHAHTLEIPSSHVPMLSHPQAVETLIESAATSLPTP